MLKRKPSPLLLVAASAVLAVLAHAAPGKGKKPKPPQEDPAFRMMFRDSTGPITSDTGDWYEDGVEGVSALFGNGGGFMLDPDADGTRHFVFSFPDRFDEPSVVPYITCGKDLCDVREFEFTTDLFSHFFGVGTVVVDDGLELSGLACNGTSSMTPIIEMALGECVRARPNFRLAWKQKKVGIELFLRCGRHDVRDGTPFDQQGTDDTRVECVRAGEFSGAEPQECDTWELRPFEYDGGAERLVCRLYEHSSGRGGDRTEIVGDFDMPFGMTVERIR